MSTKPKPPADPTVLSLINDKIDTLEGNLTREITTLGEGLGMRITELSGRVQIQNGRVGKLERGQQQLEDAQQAQGLDKKQIAALLGSGGIVGALALELAKHWLG